MRKRRGFTRWLAGAVAVCFLLLAYGYLTLPDVRPLAEVNPRTTAFMELRAREATAAGREPRVVHRWVPLGRMSAHLRRAVVQTEDAAFWGHDGVDYHELRASISRNLEERQFVRGASTITQQLAKNLYLSPSRSPVRKLRELIIARRLEAELSKTRILELYLNLIEWGDGIYGAEAAAETYYGIPASALSPAQSALLAGAIINPRAMNPLHPTPRLLARQRLILQRMGLPQPTPARQAAGERLEDSVPDEQQAGALALPVETPEVAPGALVAGDEAAAGDAPVPADEFASGDALSSTAAEGEQGQAPDVTGP